MQQPSQSYPSSLPNKKKILKRHNKQRNNYKQYPLLNLYILISMILAAIYQLLSFQFLVTIIDVLPIVLMYMYISNKISNRKHLTPNMIRIGLIMFIIGRIVIILDSNNGGVQNNSNKSNNNAGNTIGSIMYMIGVILYCMALNLGQKVRQIYLVNYLITRLLSLIIFCLQCYIVYLHYHYLYSYRNTPSTTTTITTTMISISDLLSLLLLIISSLLTITCILRYQITSPYSYSFSIFGSSCLLIYHNIFICSDTILYYINNIDINDSVISQLFQSATENTINNNNINNNNSIFALQIIIIQLFYKLCQYCSHYMIMHGILHHSNLLYQIDNYIKDKDREYSMGISTTIIDKSKNITNNNKTNNSNNNIATQNNSNINNNSSNNNEGLYFNLGNNSNKNNENHQQQQQQQQQEQEQFSANISNISNTNNISNISNTNNKYYKTKKKINNKNNKNKNKKNK